RKLRPDLTNLRANSLYLFADLDKARRYYALSGRNRTLYEVEVEGTDVRHEADMQLIIEIGKAAKDAEAVHLCKMWANGANTSNPWREVLVAKATVKSVIHEPGDKLRVFKELYQSGALSSQGPLPSEHEQSTHGEPPGRPRLPGGE